MLSNLKEIGKKFNIPVVKTFPGTVDSMKDLITQTRSCENIEGWVLRFDDGHMIKVKGDWYVRVHRTKDNLNFEKNVIGMIVNENVDDVKSFMLDDDRIRLEKFEHLFWTGFTDFLQMIEKYFADIASQMSRKEWAQKCMPEAKRQNPFIPQIIFGMFDGKDPRVILIDIIQKNLGTQTKVDCARVLWGGVRWDYNFKQD